MDIGGIIIPGLLRLHETVSGDTVMGAMLKLPLAVN
jgi:hypothetical protein